MNVKSKLNFCLLAVSVSIRFRFRFRFLLLLFSFCFCFCFCSVCFVLLSAAARHLSLTVSAKLKSKVSTKSTARVFIRRKQTLQAATATRLQCALSLLLLLPLLPLLSTSRRRRFWQSARAPHSQTHTVSQSLTHAHTLRDVRMRDRWEGKRREKTKKK